MYLQVRQQTFKLAQWLGVVFFVVSFIFGCWFLLQEIIPSPQLLLQYVVPQLVALTIGLFFIFRARSRVASAENYAKKMEESEERHMHLYRSSPVPYLNINAQGVIVLANLAALRYFGDKDNAVVGTPLLDRLDHDNELKLSIIKDKLKAGESFSDVEVLLKKNDRESRWVLISCLSYGKFTDRFVSLVDIDHQKRVDTAKTEFVTLASHQLRTPMSTIKWAVSLLENSHEPKSREQRLYYEKINNNVARLLILVEDFLQVSKLELGTFSLAKTEVDLTTILKQIVAEYEDQIRGKRIEIVTKFAQNACIFQCDPQLLHMIFSNLISNAIKYSPEAGTVSVAYAYDINQVTIAVSDDGVGIPESEHAEMFKKFYRASNVRSGKIVGNGLGLYIVKKAVEVLGGTVTFKSSEGKGTVFIIALPLNV